MTWLASRTSGAIASDGPFRAMRHLMLGIEDVLDVSNWVKNMNQHGFVQIV
jgi:hypothetical protein